MDLCSVVSGERRIQNGSTPQWIKGLYSNDPHHLVRIDVEPAVSEEADKDPECTPGVMTAGGVAAGKGVAAASQVRSRTVTHISPA